MKINVRKIYHTWFFNWLERKNCQLGNWLWAKRWRNFKGDDTR